MKRNGLDALNFQHKMNYNRNMPTDTTNEYLNSLKQTEKCESIN